MVWSRAPPLLTVFPEGECVRVPGEPLCAFFPRACRQGPGGHCSIGIFRAEPEAFLSRINHKAHSSPGLSMETSGSLPHRSGIYLCLGCVFKWNSGIQGEQLGGNQPPLAGDLSSCPAPTCLHPCEMEAAFSLYFYLSCCSQLR